MTLSLAAAAICGAACTDTGVDDTALELGDAAVYAAEVQPYVGLRCGSLDCHGDLQRALRLYAEDGLRLRAELRDQPLDDDELQANLRAFAALADDAVDDHLALLKGLAVSAGGMAHVGGDVWDDTSAVGYACVRAWLAGASDAAACAAAFESVAPASAPDSAAFVR